MHPTQGVNHSPKLAGKELKTLLLTRASPLQIGLGVLLSRECNIALRRSDLIFFLSESCGIFLDEIQFEHGLSCVAGHLTDFFYCLGTFCKSWSLQDFLSQPLRVNGHLWV